jgi:uncharacterized protein with FMN-binding domain
LKKIKIGIVFLLVLAACIGLGYGYRYYRARSAFRQAVKQQLKTLELKNIKDGIYTGEYTFKLTSAKVEVTIKENRITDIKLVDHKHSNGHSGADIIEAVISSQSLEVDTITGSTISSKAILKAIEEAVKE